MIEFKAECGHTVRAKDEDAGKAVRCAYCGRETKVPLDEQDELDFLFSDAPAKSGSAAAATQPVKGPPKHDRAGMPFRTAATRTDPFGVVKKMAYVAAVLICLIFVGKKYAWPMIEEAMNPKPAPAPHQPIAALPKPTSTSPPPPAQAESRGKGFLDVRLEGLGKEGVYVNSVPRNATAYYCAAGANVSDDEWGWLNDLNAKRVTTPASIDLAAGPHTIVVLLPINDPNLKNYRNFGYDELRTKVEAEPKRSDRDVDEYFMPDGASRVRVVAIADRINIARRYEVTVAKGRWSVLTPLFLPNKCQYVDIAQNFIPKNKAYGFEEAEIKSELKFYHVEQESSQNVLIDILHQIGTISYWDEKNGKYRLFKIDPIDGMFTAPFIEGATHGPRERGKP